MTESQKKKLKKIEKAVVSTAKKLRTKMEKKRKQIDKKDNGVFDDEDPRPNTLWVDYEFYIHFQKKKGALNEEREMKFHWKEPDLNELKKWIKEEVGFIFDKGYILKRITFEANFVRVMEYESEEYGDDYEEVFWGYEELKSPWKYGKLKIEIGHYENW